MNRLYYTFCLFFIVFSANLPARSNDRQESFEYSDYAQLAEDNKENADSKPFIRVWEKGDKATKRKFTSTFLGIGVNYLIPYGKLTDVNDDAIGFNIQLESRRYCNLWWGIRAEYFSLDSLTGDNVPPNNFKSIFTLSPSLKYVFCGDNCEEAQFKPYINGLVNFSSIKAVDEKAMMGFGLSGGAGVLMPLKFFGMCWGIDLNALYAAPNCMYRAEGRENIQYLDVSLTLSVGL